MDISFNFITEIGRLIFLAIIVILVAIIIKGTSLILLDTTPYDASVDIHRILFDKNGITFYDETLNLVYPNIIIPEKMSEDRLNKLLSLTGAQYKPSGKFILKSKDNKVVKEASWNSEDFARNEPRASEIQGRSRLRRYIKILPVHYRESNKELEGTLYITLVIPEQT